LSKKRTRLYKKICLDQDGAVQLAVQLVQPVQQAVLLPDRAAV